MKTLSSYIALVFILLGSESIYGQVGLGTSSPSSKAEFEMSSTSKGLLIPRMTQSQMEGISNPAKGLEVYNTDAKITYFYNGTRWLSSCNRVTKSVNAGTAVQLDNIKAMIPSSGNKSIVIATASGSIAINGFSINQYNQTANDNTTYAATVDCFTNQSFNSTFTTSYKYWQSAASFNTHGSSQEIFFDDATNNRSYRIRAIIGRGYNGNYITIERLH